MKIPILIVSHLVAVALGWVLFAPVPKEEGRSKAAESGGPSAHLAKRMEPDPKSENPILRATSADFADLWKRLHLETDVANSRGKTPGSISVFMDWSARDPDAALLALGDTFIPTYSHNYLNNALSEQGVHLAEPLLKHWKELDYVNKMRWMVQKAIEQIALEDPARGAEVLFEMTKQRKDVEDTSVFDEMQEDQMLAFITRYREIGGINEDGEAPGSLWSELADRIYELDPEDGLQEWLHRVEGQAAHQAIALELMEGAARFDRWDGVFEALVGLEGERLDWFLKSSKVGAGRALLRPGHTVPLLEASAQQGNWAVMERLLNEWDFSPPPDPPHVYLEWAFQTPAAREDSEAIRHAVDLALRANRQLAMKWIDEMDDVAAQARAREAVAELGFSE